jgi:dinuclear metal center YbgI/SA1388 family protein
MPAALDDFVRAVETIAPLSLAYEWDNSGLLLRCSDRISSVLITLDVTDTAVSEAAAKGCDMILSHHPLMFDAVKRLDCHRTTDAVMMRLIRYGISVYSAHTSFDRAVGGINDAFADKLGLKNVEILPGLGEDLVRTGYLEKPLAVKELAEHVKRSLGIDAVKVSQTDIEAAGKVAIVGGSGGDFIKAAKDAGAQALITGEAKHHHFLNAQAQGVLLVEAGHFDTERCFVEQAFMSLQSQLNELQLNLEMYKANSVRSPYKYI